MRSERFLQPNATNALDAFGPIVREAVFVEERTFWIEHPADSDRIVPRSYVAFWAEVWPASRMLARAIVQESWPPETETLELGCGLGLAGIAALSRGLQVTFSDRDAHALTFATHNARLNGHANHATRQLDWSQPPSDFKVPLILGADLLYEERSAAPLASCIAQLLRPDGLCLLADVERIPRTILESALRHHGLAFTANFTRAGEPGGRRVKGTLYRITHAASHQPLA